MTQHWVSNRWLCFRHYAQGMAVIDIVSTVPYDFLVQLAQISGTGASSDLSQLRALRVLRLVKLLRILRSSRVLARLQDQFYLHHSYINLFKFATSTVLLCHWMACVFHLIKSIQPNSCNWEDAYFNSQGSGAHSAGKSGGGDLCALVDPPMVSAYLAALYWAAMSISTVGCGVTPHCGY